MQTKPIIYDEIKDYFKLDSEGRLWHLHRNKWKPCHLNKPGKVRGYLNVGFNGTYYQQHRIVYCLHTKQDVPTDLSIDHKNGARHDNNIDNLRLVSHRENGQNRVEHRNGRLVGARYNKQAKKWSARILLTNGQGVDLGLFNSELEAHNRYVEALPLVHLSKEEIQKHFNVAQHVPSSQYKGVSWNKASGKWMAYITVNGKQKHLGCFEDERLAYQACLNYKERKKHEKNT